MNTSPGVPKQIEDVLITHRRGFLRNAGLFAVSIAGYSTAGASIADAQGVAGAAALQGRDHIPFPTSTRSIRGSLSMKTTRPRFT